MGKQGTEDRDSHRAPEGAEEGRPGGGHAEVGVGYRILCRQHENLHHHADAGAGDEHEHAGQPEGGVHRQPAHQRQSNGRYQQADDWEDLVAAGAGDQPP
ncbi:hypothetical protein GCM10009606_29780 [Nocardioides aquiterrae]|uniref:Uncharacterized protein n=1 Tax=Nocardioides aquiterrae TaxID=203799 RepID=A0ABN1UG24_9ACTN